MIPAILLLGWSFAFAIAVYNDPRLLAPAVVMLGAGLIVGLTLITTKLDDIAEQIKESRRDNAR